MLPVVLCMAGAAGVLGAAVAEAQETGLRGSLPATNANAPLPRGQAAQADQTSSWQYDPVSTGAVPDAGPAEPDLFSLPANADAFDGPSTASGARPLSTARQRAEAARVAAGAQPVRENRRAGAVDEDLVTAAVRVPSEGVQEDPESVRRAERENAIEARNVAREEAPFAAPGIHVGRFLLRSTLEQGLVGTSNASLQPGGSSAVLSQTALRLNAIGDWGGHSATLDAYGAIQRTLSGEQVRDDEIGVDLRLDLDLGESLNGRGEFGYLRTPESASSPVAIIGAASSPIRQTLGASLGVERNVGRVLLGVTGSVERDIYGDAELWDGSVLSQKDRDSTLASITLRGGYEVSPALTPFAEVELGRRYYDQKIDDSGYERSSNLVGARAGVALDLGEKLSGEFSAGWLRESFDDARLGPVSTPSVAAALTWSPERGTLVNLAASTTIENTTNAGESGSVLNVATLSAERAIRANLTGNAVLGIGYRNYAHSDGRDVTFLAEAGATWWLSRYAGISGRLRHERLRSSLPDRDYDANSAFLGLKLQR
ncbi:outer membrane beta-barrel protein [Mesorhizobium sp. KR2-14]|uniref:outer membrane beta-barrel protein n=1 Tax=Mesorhizobium sp. KR2-14 TaxID=3156610 RepID=UPI0032B52D8E